MLNSGIDMVPSGEDATILEIPGNGEATMACTRALERIKPFLRPGTHVIMEGEPGVGKKFHAALLHADTAGSAESAFVEITAQTSEEALRAILFDDDRRMVEQKMGNPLPSLQGRSTLFLRSIGEFGIIHQRVLSRFLIQQKSEQQSPYQQTRLVASTTIPWPDLIQKRMLVDSLAQNLQQFEVCRIPPLRERFDELPSLVQTILAELRRREKVDCTRVKGETLEQLKTRQWRDNVRELKYVIEDAAINSSDGTLKLPARLSDEIDLVWEMFRTIQAGKQLAIEQSLATLEKAIIERALIKYNFDQRKTARMLAMTEPNLTYRIKKFNIYIPASK
jgi:Nif-specific regulatory protein